MNYKVLLTTTGTGSRLGDLTKNENKCFILVNKRPAITYIIDKYPKKTEFIVTIGYLADQVKERLPKLYPSKKFTFVNVNPYEGHGSSLGYSMFCTKNNLQCPFIFHACDTIVIEDIPEPNRNFVIGYIPPKEMDARQYRTHTIRDGKIIRMNDKGVKGFDTIHIGIIGIYDFEHFWKVTSQLCDSNEEGTGLSDVHVIEKMIKEGASFNGIMFSQWFDTGNLMALEKTIEYFKNNVA